MININKKSSCLPDVIDDRQLGLNKASDAGELCSMIEVLRNDIAELKIKKNNFRNYTQDAKYIPDIVTVMNDKYPMMNLKYIISPALIKQEIREAEAKGVTQCRFVISVGLHFRHFACADYRLIGDQVSLIIFDPASKVYNPVSTLICRVGFAIKELESERYHFAAITLDIQKSDAECGIFSLSLAKNAYVNAGTLTKLHQDNIEKKLPTQFNIVIPEESDKYLPPSFFKHAQTRKRIDEYLRVHPSEVNTIVNKKGETLIERYQRHTATIDQKIHSLSSHEKRISYYKSLVTLS